MALIFVALLYFLPTCIAAMRHHRHQGDVFLLNLVFGWTGLGWFATAIWAASGSADK